MFDRASIGVRLDKERRRASLLGDMREAIFGAQDGLVSTLAVVSTVSGAASGFKDPHIAVLIAGIATALAGIFSMAAGEYLSSKSQREIALAQIADEREKCAMRPREVQAELAYMLEEDGLPSNEAGIVADVMARHPEVLLNVKVDGSIIATAAVLFGIGVVKTRWTHRNPVGSGLEILVIGAFAGIAGFFFGNVLPALLGVPAAGG